MPRKNKHIHKESEADKQRHLGGEAVSHHPIFSALWGYARATTSQNQCPQDGWAVVDSNGYIYMHPTRLASANEWSYMLAHCLLHLGFGHFQEQRKHALKEWNAACDCYIACFLADLKFGETPPELRGVLDTLNVLGLSHASEERLFEEFCMRGIPEDLFSTGTAGKTPFDIVFAKPLATWQRKAKWQEIFGHGLADAVTYAVDVAGGVVPSTRGYREESAAQKARKWFVSHYPLLGALAASFEIIEDPLICHRMDIHVAAVNPQMKEIYINPSAGLNEQELRFVMAHELLHVGLRHDIRCEWRDPYYWNVACDYVINGWLSEMGVGDFPHIGGLYDEELKRESAEAIYDRIVNDLRRFRKLTTMRGVGLSDILGEPDWWSSSAATGLDEFYRNCLSQGLALHQEQGRGYLSAGLIEEIRALGQPPIPWDVELAHWFDRFFPPIEKTRTYARASRRQSSTPDIARPLWVTQLEREDGRTFGVLLDTSGSMDRQLLAKALGAIASYSMARDVQAARVIFCDAAPFDQGYMAPDEIAERVKVRGRGGTILQPGIDLLDRCDDFPKNAPLLIITDGYCDKLHIRREHAFLLPFNRTLPFKPWGEVFRLH